MLNKAFVYDIIYALMACDGRQEALFGSCAPYAHEQFERSCPGDAFPELWFELPLAGEPWFDLHVLTARETLEPHTPLGPEVTGGHPEAFAWFAGADDVRQLALSYDTHSNPTAPPNVQLLVRDPRQHEAFLALVGGQQAADAYRAFAARLPEGWFPCYSGAFAARGMEGVRVECIPRSNLQQLYAKDPELLEAHLRQAGFSALGSTLVPRCQLLAQTPFQLEFQFDVRPDGSCGDTLGASVRFDCPPGSPDYQCFEEDGAAGELSRQLERWGLADERWHLLAHTIFAKSIRQGGSSVTGYSYPAFYKLRWRAGEPLDAKTYLIAGFQEPEDGRVVPESARNA